MGGPNPDKGKHANRKYSTAWSDGAGRFRPFRRSHHLYSDAGQKTAIETHFGQQQAPSGWDPTDATKYPQYWAKANKLRRVPKVVILSTYCNWWELWKQCDFIYPNAQPFTICGQSIMSQYCGVYQYDVDVGDANTYQGAGPWDPRTSQLLDTGGQYFRSVGKLDNPMSDQHRELTDSWKEIADAVNADENDPIFVIVPQWAPKYLASYKHSLVCFNYVFNGRAWYLNAQPEYDAIPNGQGYYYYPAADKPENANPFGFGSGVPCLLTGTGGFRTNVLHLYCGHWCQTMLGTNSCFGFESWPVGPAGDYLVAGLYEGNYTTNSTILPGLNGIRATWYDCGSPFGFSTVTGSQLVDYYDKNGVLGLAAQQYIDNFYKHRNIGVRLFTYDQNVDCSNLSFDNIRKDRLEYHELRFYFGSDHCCDPFMYDSQGNFVGWCNEDDTCLDTTDPSGLKVGEFISHRPTLQAFRDAQQYYWTKIIKRIGDYYGGLNSGTADFFKAMVTKYGLDAYNVSYEGSASAVEGGAAIDYARQYFADQEKAGL